MTTQPEALRLAECLDEPQFLMYRQAAEAAGELRRLHQSEREGWRYAAELELERNRLNEAHDWQYKMAGDRLRRIEKLEKVNHELSEALKLAVRQNEHDMLMTGEELRVAYAAICKAEGQA